MKALRWYSGPSATTTILIPALPCERDPSHSLSVVGESECGAVKFQGKFYVDNGRALSSRCGKIIIILISYRHAEPHWIATCSWTRGPTTPLSSVKWHPFFWTIHKFGNFNVDIIFPLPSYVLSLYYESCYVRFHLTWSFFSFATPPCQWPLIQAYRKYPSPTTSPVNDNQLEAIFGHYYSTTINCRYVL